jgi:hypothetical protein
MMLSCYFDFAIERESCVAPLRRWRGAALALRDNRQKNGYLKAVRAQNDQLTFTLFSFFFACSYWVCKVIILINLAFVSVLPLWGTPGSGGLNTALELYIAGGIFGFQAGAYQSFSRMLLSHFTPIGCESEFFSIYELTDKGSAWMGPLVLTLVFEKTQDYRWGFFAIVLFFVLGATILLFVDVKQGGLQALDFHLSKEVAVEELMSERPSARVAVEPDTDADLKRRAMARKRTLTAGALAIANPASLLSNDAVEEAGIGLESPRPTTTTRPRNQTECASTRGMPLPELPSTRSDSDDDEKQE